ncbi:obscurin isoform X5 [Lycorma delicatula]|uniref:obscurin isoform X5 n=1 Tax=Lycorma delicatula TaxID=130591 RepID=UPI003F516870
MSMYSKTVISTKKKQAFTAELSEVLGRRGMAEGYIDTKEDSQHMETEEYNEDREIYVAKRDYFSEDENSLALRKGEKVIFLKVDRSDSSTAKKPRLDPELDLGDSDSSSLPLLDNTAAKHKMSIRPKRKHTDSRHRSDNTYEQRWLVQSIDEPTHQGWVPSSILSLHDESPEGPNDARFRREAVIRELVETEEEFGRDIQQVVDHYLKPLDNKSVPSIVRENKELIFGNLKQIAELHNSVLIEGVKYYANEPRMLGKTFIRLERDFDKHVAYCRDEPAAQEFLQENDAVHEYFEEVSQRLGDDKSLSEHLKLPIQRINDYQLLLKELVKYSTILGEDTTDLGKALELMLAVPHRANDNKFISNIEGFHGNIHKLGRLLRHDWFSVTDCEGKSKDRYLFLFKARILVCKVRRISEDRFVFLLKDIIRIPEVEIKDHKDSDRIFELHHKQPGFGSYPLTISAHKDRVKNAWLSEIREYASDILALAEHAADDLRLQSQPEDKKNLEPLTGIQLGPGTPGQELPIERISNEQNKENILPQILSKASKLKEVSKSKASEEIKQSKQSEEEIKVSDSNISVKRKEENEDKELPSEKKVKVEEETEDDNMDRFASSRKSVSSRRVEEFRSVSSTTSQEVYVETSSTHHQMSSSSSSSRSMKMVEESAAINGRTISQFREVTGDVDGFSSIQGITAGSKGADSFTTIEEVSSGTRGSVDYTSGKRDSKDFLSKEAILGSESVSVKKSSSSSGSKSAFSKTIGSNSLNLGERAIFECEVDENAKVMWLKDNKPLSFEGQSDRFTIVSSDSSHRLEISDVKESDVGSYTARAYNTATNSSSYCTAQLAIDKKVGEDMKLDGHAPFFIVHLKDTELLENTYLRFMIKVKGAPNPDVKFYKDDLLITSVHPRVSIVKENADKGFYELVIDDVQQEDAGKYKCVASNSHGEVECEAIVTVTDEKKLFEGLEESELLAPGETPHFTWLRDGQPFDPEERFKVLFKDEEDSLALVFQHVKPEDAGLYTCVASTSTGKISCSAELTVQGSINQLLKEPEKPKITTEIKKQEASIGGSAMLELKIEGFPKPQVQWTKDNQEIKADSRHKFLYEDDETMSLVIKGVTPDDAGEYHVKASNDLGDDSDVIHLTVKAPPKFKRKLSDFETMAGEDIHLTVDVEGIPKPTIQWYKDGLLIKKSDRVKMFEEASTEYTLLIEKSTLDDGGSYSVVATNELSQCSEFCHVQVHSPPQFIKGMIKTVETKEGDNASFQVKVQGDPKPSVKWLHNGKELKSDGKHIKISEDDQIHTLTLSGIARGDAGKYSCEISNKHGTNSDNADLNVRCSPQFRTKLSDMKANEGDTNIEFTVNVEAFPKPNVQWFHDEVEITEKVTEFTRVEEGDNYKLVIKEVTKELSGKYTCKVVNELGENTSSSTFTVYSKPKFRKGLKDVQVDEGASLTLEVEIEGVPEPTVKWYKNGQEVSGDAHIKISRDSKRVENYSLTFTLIKPEDGGEYEVRASNEMGTTVSQSTVTVHTKTSHIEDSELVEERQKKVPKKEEAEINERVNDETTKKAIDENDLRTKPKNAEDSEGLKPSKKVTVEDIGDDEKDIFLTNGDKEHPGSFTCVEVKFDESEVNDFPGSNAGLVEEYSDSEDKLRPPVNRGISIHSVSEEETKLSLSPDDEQVTPKGGFVFNNEIIENGVEDHPAKSDENDISGSKKGNKYLFEEVGVNENSKPQSLDNDIDAKRPRKSSKFDVSEQEDGIVDSKVHMNDMNGDINGYVNDIRKGSKAELNELKQSDLGKDSKQKLKYSDMNGNDDHTRRASKATILNDEDGKLLKGDLMDKTDIHNGPQSLTADSERNSKQNFAHVANDIDKSKRKQSVDELSPTSRKQSVMYDKETAAKVNGNHCTDGFEKNEAGLVNGDIKQKGKRSTSFEDDELDPQVAELLKRVQKQRSVLEEILDKEGERAEILDKQGKKEGKGADMLEEKHKKEDSFDGEGRRAEVLGKEGIKEGSLDKKEKTEEILDKESGKGEMLDKKTRKESLHEDGKRARITDEDGKKADILDKEGRHEETLNKKGKSVEMLDKDSTKGELLDKKGRKEESLDDEGNKAKITDKHGKKAEVLDNESRHEEALNKKGKSVEMLDKDSTKGELLDKKGSKEESFDDEGRRAEITDKEGKRAKASDKEGRKEESLDDDGRRAGVTDVEGKRAKVFDKEARKEESLDDDDDDGRRAGVTDKEGKNAEVLDKESKKRESLDNEGKRVKVLDKERKKSERLDKEGDEAIEAFPQIISAEMESKSVFESLPSYFEVNAVANPRPDVKWYKDGKPIEPSKHVELIEDGDKYKLKIDAVEKDDGGNYKCVVSNRLGEKVQEANLIVMPVSELRCPKVKVPLKDLKIPKCESGELIAIFTADPEPEIKWTHDGNEVDADFIMSKDIKLIEDGLYECTFTLKIPAGKHEDTGTYKIEATNKYGFAESSARLDIILRPEILVFKDVTVTPHEDTELVAVIIANPKPKISWSFENKTVKDDDRHKIVNNDDKEIYKLELKSAGKADEGVYKLTASNSAGETSAEARINVHTEPPVFVKKIEDQTIREYAPAEFKVRANGVPKPEISWFKDGKKLKSGENGIIIETLIEGQVSSTLSIEHFNKNHEGSFTVKAVNMCGEDECSAKLKMAQIAPSFLKPLDRSTDVCETEPLELKAKIEGSPLPQVKWFKDGEELPGDDRIRLTTSPDGTIKLNIDSVKPADSGQYKLVVANPNGETTGICAVVVNPAPKKPAFIKELANIKGIEGEPLSLEAQIEGYPEPKVKWLKDGHPVRPSQSLSFVKTPGGQVGIEIDSVRPEDAGSYSLTISNKLGEETSKAQVEVSQKEKKPQFLLHLMPTSVVEGFPAKMEVKVTGYPKPELTWSLNGKPLVVDGKHIKIVPGPDGSECLVIDKTTPKDAGEYSVTAKNSQGEVTTKAPLNVTSKNRKDSPEEKPAFIKDLRDTYTDEGLPLSFSAPIIGNPIPDVEWEKDGVKLEPDDRIQITCDGNKVGLEINPSKLSDAGSFKCKLSNPLGQAESSAKGNVKKIYQPPKFTQRFTDIQQIPSYDVKFLARVSGVPKPDLSWYKNGKPIHDSDKYRIKQDGDSYCLYVKDISPDDAGKYKCIATNREGEASCEAQLQVVDKIEKTQRMEPPSFLKKIGDCEVYKGMTAKFTACATGYPEPDVEWYRGDDKLYPSERIRIEKEGTGLLRLCIVGVDPDVDIGKYRCRIFNPYGEDSCEANIVYDSLEIRPRKPIGDQYTDFEKYQSTGVPLPLSDPPIISRMTDRKLTLSWKPSIPHGPREPVTYLVEMCEQPDGEWFTARKGVRSCVCEIHNLEPFRDYKFRIRVENKYGTSDPSPFALTHRARLAPEPPKFTPHLPPGVDFHPETSPYFPKDFDIDRPPHDKYAQAPRFLRQEHDTQYGVKGHNCNLFWFVYGYPKPKMQYFFNDEPIEMGGRYDSSYTRNGQATLFINKMLDRDVGVYEAVATNEHGQARQRVRLEIAEYPQFLQRPEETVIMTRKSGRLIARVVGVPYPEIKWFKDWQPLASSSRVKIQFIEPDQCVLTINDAMTRDEGLYSISASNIAGTVSSSVMVRVEENEAEYSYMNYDKVRNVKARTKPIHDKYDLGDELGRGTQGITYHAVERSTGRNYAAKVMHGKGSLRALMRNELDIMNQLNHRKLIRLQDAYEDPTRFTLVMELAGGGELLEALTKQTFTTESEIASYIRQVLWGLEHMHDQNIAHLGLTPGDLLISHAGGDDLKICDFGLSRRIPFGKHASLEYGMPEYVSPEIVKGDGVGTPADLWALGIITHVLLTGISPFKGNNDMETLDNIKENKWSFQEDIWSKFTKEARDFITRLLTVQQEARMTIKEALKHPWLNLANKIPANEYNITTDSLRNYYNSLKDWYSNASCRKWYRQQPLSGAYTHPSHMVYPPGGIYTPEDTPERYLKDKEPKQPRTWEDQIPSREPVDYELGLAKSESHYQNGPDTYLLQLRDVDFPVRLREYMKVAANRTPTGLGFTRESLDQQPHIDWRAPVIRERRRFTDIMDEEIDDERKARINRYGSPDTYTLRRLRNEIGTRLDAHVEAEALIEAKRDGHAPFFREKPQITPIREEQNAELSCLAVGDPKPIIQWFKNDLVIGESNRIKIIEDESGRSVLRLQPALSIDAGIYKVVARNKVGQTVARTRLVMATVPGAPDSPDVSEISDTEVLLRWKLPRDDGNSPILCYNLQYKEAESVEWTDVASNIDHEFWVVRNLRPKTGHQFRLAARNNLGWSPKGIPTETIKTKEPGAPKITITSAMRHYQTLSESGLEIKPEDSPVSKTQIDYNKETSPIQWSTEQPTDKYNFISEIHRGQFSVVVKGIKKSNEEVVVGKLLEWQSDTEEQVNQEFEALRSLRHERIASLLEAFRPSGSNIAVFIEEKLQGADILTYLSSRHEYTEQMVATVITQILDALHYLHWRGFCHLNVQPDNIVMASIRSVQVKLVDLGSAQPVSKLGTVVKKTGSLEYSSPEVLSEEPAFPQSDIWSVGILAYILLSGASPFAGTNNEETRRNINFVRYRFEHLYKELTQEATRFIMLIFKRTPSKRPTAEECHEHRWLLPTEYMIKRRERAVFLGNRLKEFSDKYHSKRTEEATQWDPLSNTVVGKGPLARSNSIQEELLITF